MSAMDPYAETNALVREFADRHRMKRMKLGDGEVVIRLRAKGGFASLESPAIWGFYCPRARAKAGIEAALAASGISYDARSDLSTESEAYFRVSWLSGCLLLSQAGIWVGARRKRPAPAHLPRLAG